MGAISTKPILRSPASLPWKALYAIVGLVAFVIYIGALWGAPVWDDWDLISGAGVGGGTVVGALTKPMMYGYFRPLANLWILGENTLFHGNTFYYHLLNVAILACTCILLMGLLRTCYGSKRIAFAGGLAMAIHPAMVSALGWVSGVTNALAVCAVAGSAWTLVLSYKDAERATRWTIISAVLFALSLFAKEQAISFVLIFPLAARVFTQKPEPASTFWKRQAPFVIATLLFLIAWKTYFPGYPSLDRTIAERIQMIGQSTCYYTLLLVAPTGKLLQTYTLGPFSSAAWTWAILGYILLLSYIWAWFRIQRVDPILGWFGAFLFLAFVTMINIAPPPSFELAPYRAPLAVLPFAAIVGILVGRAKHIWVIAMAAALGCWWVAMVYVTIPTWSDDQSLYTAIVDADPHFLRARINLAATLIKSNSGDAVSEGQEAVRQLEIVLTEIYGSDAWRDPSSAVRLLSDPDVTQRLARNKGPADPNSWMAGVFVRLAEARSKMGDAQGARVALEEGSAVNKLQP